jgi:hypothetical protein
MHRVKGLSPEQKVAVEALLGRAVSSDDLVPSQLSPEERAEALRKLDRYFAKVDSGRKHVSEEKEETIFIEAMRSVRPNYRPIE